MKKQTLLRIPSQLNDPFVPKKGSHTLPFARERIVEWLKKRGAAVTIAVQPDGRYPQGLLVDGRKIGISIAVYKKYFWNKQLTHAGYRFNMSNGEAGGGTNSPLDGMFIVFWDIPERPFYFLDRPFIDRVHFLCKSPESFPRPIHFMGNLGKIG